MGRLKSGIYIEPEHTAAQKRRIQKMKGVLREIAAKMAKEQAEAQYKTAKLIDRLR